MCAGLMCELEPPRHLTMNFRQYMMVMGLGSAAAILGWLVVFYGMDPISSGVPSRIAFYVMLFFACLGTITFVGTAVRVLIVHKDALVSREVARAFRHALLFSSLIVLDLVLASAGLLRWWTLVLSILFVTAIELFFLTARRGARM